MNDPIASATNASIRAGFETWLDETMGFPNPEWQEERNCYKNFGVHLAWKAWQEQSRLSAVAGVVDAEPPQPSLYGRSREETLRLAREVLGCAIPTGEARQGILWAKRFADALLSPLTNNQRPGSSGTGLDVQPCKEEHRLSKSEVEGENPSWGTSHSGGSNPPATYGDAFEFWWKGDPIPKGWTAQKQIAWEAWKASASRSSDSPHRLPTSATDEAFVSELCKGRCHTCREGYPYTEKSKAEGTFLFHAVGEAQLPCDARDLRVLAARCTRSTVANIDRSEAVNLASNILEDQYGLHLTRKGIRSLAEAVMRMDEVLRTRSATANIPFGEKHPHVIESLFEEECKDGDKVAAALGVPRTEGGRLQVARMVNRINALEANIHALEDAITSELFSGARELVFAKRASMLKPEELISTK